MQRWWFLENQTKLEQSPSIVATPSHVSVEPVQKRRQWTFRVFVRQQLTKFESIGVTGECGSLGAWSHQHCVELVKEDGG